MYAASHKGIKSPTLSLQRLETPQQMHFSKHFLLLHQSQDNALGNSESGAVEMT